MLRTVKYTLWLLLPFGVIHFLIVTLRNRLYDWNVFKTKRLPKLVISIGNIQMGGTGKTPLTIAILRKLQSSGAKVAILSRGYKRGSHKDIIISKPEREPERDLLEAIGDEPSIILESLTEGTLGIGSNRWRVGNKIIEQDPVDLFLLDDGFQHRRLHRDLDICLIDVTRWAGHSFLFPFSYLRDCKSSLKRCNAAVLTKTGNNQDKAGRLRSEIRDKYRIPVFEGELVPQALIPIGDGARVNISEMSGRKVAAFCGIGNPNHFFDTLRRGGMKLVLKKKYPDHYAYTPEDIDFLESTSKEKKVNSIVTTEKDAVKLRKLLRKDSSREVEFLFLKVDFVVKEENEFFKLLEDFASSKSFN